MHEDMNRAAGTRPRGRAARPGRHPDPPRAAQALPAPALRRHAPTGDDRDGGRLQPDACSSPTSRRPPSTSPCRPASSTCCATCATGSAPAVVLITHDLGVIADIADRVVVMYAGRVVERATADELFERPRHHYTTGLLGAVPAARTDGADQRLREIPGLVPILAEQPDACTFADRCPAATDQCTQHQPPLEKAPASAHEVACWHPSHGRERRGCRRVGPMSAPAYGRRPGLRGRRPGDALRPGARRRRRLACASTAGKVMALVGESGSGKSTVGRLRRAAAAADLGHGATRRRGRHAPVAPGAAGAPQRTSRSSSRTRPSSLDPRMPVGDDRR